MTPPPESVSLTVSSQFFFMTSLSGVLYVNVNVNVNWGEERKRFTRSREKKNRRCIFEMSKMWDKESTCTFTLLEVAIEITIYIDIG